MYRESPESVKSCSRREFAKPRRIWHGLRLAPAWVGIPTSKPPPSIRSASTRTATRLRSGFSIQEPCRSGPVEVSRGTVADARQARRRNPFPSQSHRQERISLRRAARHARAHSFPQATASSLAPAIGRGIRIHTHVFKKRWMLWDDDGKSRVPTWGGGDADRSTVRLDGAFDDG